MSNPLDDERQATEKSASFHTLESPHVKRDSSVGSAKQAAQRKVTTQARQKSREARQEPPMKIAGASVRASASGQKAVALHSKHTASTASKFSF